jgi:jumonji domain-containing protein 2
MNDLDSLLKYSVGSKCKGVNLPYNYFGSWKTLFCWHKEDLDLSAINYIHEGKSKFWYSVPTSQGKLMETVTRKVYPEHYSKCP